MMWRDQLTDWWARYEAWTPGMPPALRVGLAAVVVIALALLLAHILF